MRAILHVLPDDSCRKILQNIISAMNADSLLLIDEMVFPATKVSRQAAQSDLTMMSAHASIDPTETHWQVLLGPLGLRVRDSYLYGHF